MTFLLSFPFEIEVLQPVVKYPRMVTRSIVHAVKVIRVKSVKDVPVDSMVNRPLKVKCANRASARVISIRTKKAHAIRSVVNV